MSVLNVRFKKVNTFWLTRSERCGSRFDTDELIFLSALVHTLTEHRSGRRSVGLYKQTDQSYRFETNIDSLVQSGSIASSGDQLCMCVFQDLLSWSHSAPRSDRSDFV
jgi:hypothetical protein